MSTLLMVSGSLRRDSLNARLLTELAERLDPAVTVDVLAPPSVGLPLFDQDQENDPCLRDRLAAIHARFLACDGIVVASPEYNGQPSAYLKNLVDWVSRLAYIDHAFANPFRDKPVLLCSASTGWSGGAVAIPSARALFGYVGSVVLGDTICIPHADQAWTGDGFALDPFFDEQISEALAHLVRQSTAFDRSRMQL